MIENPLSERYFLAQRLGIDVKSDTIPAPSGHAPRLRSVQQNDRDLAVYERDNPRNYILCTEGVVEVRC